MSLQKKVTEGQDNNKSTYLANGCIQCPTTEGHPRPRCLATLPMNIEELICQFKKQEKGLSLVSPTHIN